MNPEDARSTPIPLCDCGLAAAANLLADRWTVLVLREAFYGVGRFEDIRADLQIPKATLTKRLNSLIDAGLLQKVSYEEPGQRLRERYALSEQGRRLALPLLALMQWGDDALLGGKSALALTSKTSGARVRVGFVDEDGNAVRPDQVAYTPRPPTKKETSS